MRLSRRRKKTLKNAVAGPLHCPNCGGRCRHLARPRTRDMRVTATPEGFHVAAVYRGRRSRMYATGPAAALFILTDVICILGAQEETNG